VAADRRTSAILRKEEKLPRTGCVTILWTAVATSTLRAPSCSRPRTQGVDSAGLQDYCGRKFDEVSTRAAGLPALGPHNEPPLGGR
jgi:hypothetical protein